VINLEEFRSQAHELVDWMADYLKDIRKFPVKSQVSPGEIFQQIPDHPPNKSESIPAIMEDFVKIILPGITHWQHPNFHAYFSGNSSYPSVLAEMLTATLAAQCMLWETSPAATELEEKMMEWLKSLLALPSTWTGVIQDTASTATLVAILSARESKSKWNINKHGFFGGERFTVYCSEQAHSSVEKAVRVAGLGSEALRKIPVDPQFSMQTDRLAKTIAKDQQAGYTPLAVVATLGTTGSTAVDAVPVIGSICEKSDIWLHVDAAWAGTAMLLAEYRWMNQGLELADSFVFNPHKWMFTNFDCSAYFVQDPAILRKTFSLVPEYLKTGTQDVNNYSEWGIQLGRRFRALKLWFVMRNFGADEMRKQIKQHITWAKNLVSDCST
jgi:aromatic-L-amino-acid decarboxylase